MRIPDKIIKTVLDYDEEDIKPGDLVPVKTEMELDGFKYQLKYYWPENTCHIFIWKRKFWSGLISFYKLYKRKQYEKKHKTTNGYYDSQYNSVRSDEQSDNIL